MRTILRILLDTLFPQTEHERLLRTTTVTDFSSRYIPTSTPNGITLAHYSSRRVQAAVAACKFEKNQHAAELLGSLVAQWLRDHPNTGETIMIPIPLSRARQKERGFNQVTRVLETLPASPLVRIEKNWLLRPTDTTRQTSLGRKDRLKNMKDAFTVSQTVATITWCPISRIIICDDVLTTGATMKAARTILAKHVPKHVTIICLAWAH